MHGLARRAPAPRILFLLIILSLFERNRRTDDRMHRMDRMYGPMG
jgi:hypothetical protein